jgi:hypothetical protein
VIANGTKYACLDVTGQIVFSSPGYSMLKEPVTFMSVKFEAVCPQRISNCGDQSLNLSKTGTVIRLAAISFDLSFSDHTVERVFGLLPLYEGAQIVVLSNHVSPGAGFLLEYATGASPTNVRVMLLVEKTQ